MSKLKGQGFWLGAIVAVAVLVVGFVVLVLPLYAKQGTEQKKVKGLATKLSGMKMVGAPDVAAAREYREKMVKEYGDIVMFYAESDEHLERWFRTDWNNDPPRDAFMSTYRGEIQRIHKELKDKGTEVGVPDENDENKRKFGFCWEDPGPQDFQTIGADEKRVLKELQKRFWARQRVADVILKSRDPIKVTRVHDFRFARRLHERLNNASWEMVQQGPDAVHYPGFSDPSGQVSRAFQEYDLPNELGRTTTFGFALQLPYSEVPKVIREILQPGGEGTGDSGKGRLLVNLLGAHVTIREQNLPTKPYTFFKGDTTTQKAEEEKIRAEAKARDVLLIVTCQIIDFEPAKVKKFEQAPEAK
jgi:hypothetical protein